VNTKDLSKTLDVNANRVQQSADSLIEKGLVAKEGDRYVLTQKGKDLANGLYPEK
jgi:Mn-dependent DtxR family transcriptional regulator